MHGARSVNVEIFNPVLGSGSRLRIDPAILLCGMLRQRPTQQESRSRDKRRGKAHRATIELTINVEAEIPRFFLCPPLEHDRAIGSRIGAKCRDVYRRWRLN